MTLIIGLIAVVALIGFVALAVNGNAAMQSAVAVGNVSSGTIDIMSSVDAFSSAMPAGGSSDGIANIDITGWQQGNQVTTDENTWPSGDKIWDICRAIACAEGYNVASSNPFRLNNPGDISDGANTFGFESHSGSNITTFPDAATGWNWLYTKISNHVNGKSTVFPASMTVDLFAKKYAANWQNWESNVCTKLRILPSSTFAQYVNS